VIVVNQGAPDLAERLSYDLNMKVMHQAERGLSRARNASFQTFTGDWIAFIDDDEEANAEWIEQIGLAIESRPEIDFLGGVYFTPVGYKHSDGYCSELYALGEQRLGMDTWLLPMGHPLLQRDIWGGNSVYSRRCYDKIGGYDEWLGRGAPDFLSGEDTDYNVRAISAGMEGLLSARVIIYHTYGTRPHSDDAANESAAMGAVMRWKSEQDPGRIHPELAARLQPFGRKKEKLARYTGGRLFPEHQVCKQIFDAATDLLDRKYVLRDGCLGLR
jgi:glycosyltransferase involved in cell wall biosynthesis